MAPDLHLAARRAAKAEPLEREDHPLQQEAFRTAAAHDAQAIAGVAEVAEKRLH
jgi:hypothetical protein